MVKEIKESISIHLSLFMEGNNILGFNSLADEKEVSQKKRIDLKEFGCTYNVKKFWW